jgi:hypothetical protein
MEPMNKRLLLCLLLVGCPTGPDDDDSFVPDDEADDVIVVHAPFSGDATVAVLDPTTLAISDGLLGLVGSDWHPATADGSPFLLGRYGIDVLRRYSDTDFGAPTFEVSTGAGTNPQDLASCGGSLFLSRYDSGDDGGADIVILDPTTGAETGRIDLSAYAEGTDGNPEPAQLVVIDETMYVALERMDRDAGWVPDPTGRVLAIDCASATIVEDFVTGPNPDIEPAGDAIAIRTDEGVQLLVPGQGVTDVLETADFGTTVDLVGLGASDRAGLLVLEQGGEAANEVWCVDLDTGARELLASREERAWSVRSGPGGRVWVLWRDHWATGDVEAGGIGIYDPTACGEVGDGLLVFPTDPSAIAFRSGS